ncbi:MAG TPA: protein kinase [Vicinamibacteria bacterium]|nr:protein kinase [Vicinamibacteria bacterium]
MNGPQSGPAPGDAKERIGKYEILARLGKGAMGVIYHALDPMLERDVALKVMAPQIADDPDQKARFEREARAVARIVHPNVLTVFDLGYHHDGSPYIAMELLKGKDLLRTLREDLPLPLGRKVGVILQVLEGLSQAHQVGIVHRDIKPANVFLTVDGTVKIMDFGVARFTKANVTGTGSIMGTADYMSPEQVQGAKVDGRSDLWSTGCMLYEMLGSRRPFGGDTLMTVFYKITHDDPDILELPEGRVHDLLRAIVGKALAKDADERYQTAGEFAAALRECLSEALPAAVPGSTASPPAARPPARDTLDLGAVAAAAVAATDGDVAKAPVDEAPTGPVAPAKRASAVPGAPAVPVPVPPVPAPPPPVPAPAAAPRLADPMPLFRLIRDIYVSGKSGHLHFTHGRERRSLFFMRGHIVHGTTDVEGEHLGHILVRYGLISQPDLERATAIVLSERKRLGLVLDELGIMDRSRLEEAVGLHVREILFSVAGRADGSYSFEEMSDEGSMSAGLTSQIPPGQVILEAARRLQSPEMMTQVLGDVDRTLVPSSNMLLRVQKLTLSPADGFVLSRVDGSLSAREVFQIIPLPQEDTERSLFGLLCTGALEFVPRTATSRARMAMEAERAEQAPAMPAGRPAPPPPSLAASAAAAEAARKAQAEKQREEAARAVAAQRHAILDAYEGIKTRDFFEFLAVARDADERKIKEAYFRLAKPFHPDTALDPSLSDLRSKREAVFLHLGQVYETLRNPGNRARYERMLDARTPRRPAEPAPAAGGAPPPPPPPEDRTREIEAALDAVRSGARLVKEGKYWDAIQLLEPAVARLEGPPRLKARVTLARAYVKNPNWLRRAEESLQAVLQESPEHAEAYVVLGQVYRASDQRARAVTMFRRALELQPGYEEAVAELAALEPPRGDPGSGKILKKLFGK